MTYITIYTILDNPKIFPLTPEAFNIFFIYASKLYNLWDYYGDNENLGYDLWEKLAHHKLATKEVVDNILNAHANAVFNAWSDYVNNKTDESLETFVVVVYGYLQQWSCYLTAKFPNKDERVEGYYGGLYLNKRLNDERNNRFTSDNLFLNYKAIDDNTVLDSLEMKLYFSYKHSGPLPNKEQMEARWREVKYERAWKQMLEQLERLMSNNNNKSEVNKIRKLDIYKSLKSFNIGNFDLEIQPDFNTMSTEQINEFLLHRQLFDLQKMFIEGIEQFNEKHNRKASLNYYYPAALFNDSARKILEDYLLVQPLPINDKRLQFVLIDLMKYIETKEKAKQVIYLHALFDPDENPLIEIEQALAIIANDTTPVPPSEDEDDDD